MSTRAVQIEILLAGIRDASTGELVNGGTAYFYSAGTTTAKNVWTEKEKTNPFTSYTLSAIGTALLYGDGVYKINVLDADGAQVSGFPRDNVKVRHPNYYNRAVSSTTTQTSDDDFLEVDTTAGAVTINLLAVASWVSPLKVMHTAGANAITLDPSGSELIEGAASYAFTAVGTIIEVVPNAAGTALRIAGIRSATLDSDGDTGIEVERTADVDAIYFKTAGVDRMVINATATDVDALSIAGGLQTAPATEVNSVCDGNTATAAELSELHSQGAVAADFAKLHAVAGTTIADTASTQNLSGKTATDGFRVTGGDLTIRPASGTVARVLAGTAAETALTVTAGGYTSQNDSGMVAVYSSDDATYPGIVALIGSNGTAGATGLTVSATGVVNIPVGLQIGGVAVGASPAEINSVCDGRPLIVDSADTGTWGCGSGGTTLDLLDLGTVTAGDIFLAHGYGIGSKGATAGQNKVDITKYDGTATIAIHCAAGNHYAASGDTVTAIHDTRITVTGSGTLRVIVTGYGLESTWTVTAAGISAIFLKKQ